MNSATPAARAAHTANARPDFAPTLPYTGHPQALYAAFFGLNKEPFSIAPDPRFLFMSESHREALAHLLYGLAGGGGFVLLTGEIGAGKTTVCRAFLEQIPAHCAVAYIFNPQLSAPELLQTVCDEFGIALAPRVPGAATVKEQIDALNLFLLTEHAKGRQGVLIIDEAQSLSAPVLEQLRLLTNLETADRKLLQIVLIGQPELRTLLAQPELEQLAQRVIARYHLPALAEGQTQAYMQHRWAIAGSAGSAGAAGALPFDVQALRLIHRLTAGVPRRINLLCDRALLGAYAQGRTRVDAPTVKQAALEVALRPVATPGLSVPWSIGGSGWPSWRGLARMASLVLALVLIAGALATVATVVTLRWLRPAALAVVDATPASAASVQPAASGALSKQVAAGSGPVVAVAAPGAPALAASSSALLPLAARPAGPPAALAAAFATAATAADVLAAAHANPALAWRELGPLWGLSIAAGDACEAAATAQVLCFRSRQGLGVVRQIDRPGVLTLHDAQDRPRYALLLGLSAEGAVLAAGPTRWTLPLAELARIWRGEFATFWRAPVSASAGDVTAAGAVSGAWLQRVLDQQRIGTPDQPLAARIGAFQLVQGLPPDGRAGPLTLMQLNRLNGAVEPTLSAGPASSPVLSPVLSATPGRR